MASSFVYLFSDVDSHVWERTSPLFFNRRVINDKISINIVGYGFFNPSLDGSLRIEGVRIFLFILYNAAFFETFEAQAQIVTTCLIVRVPYRSTMLKVASHREAHFLVIISLD